MMALEVENRSHPEKLNARLRCTTTLCRQKFGIEVCRIRGLDSSQISCIPRWKSEMLISQINLSCT